jgi:putative addiction module killer protein
MMIEVQEYRDRSGRSPFREWFDGLNAEAARKVTTSLYRVGLGNFSNVKVVGPGVYECRIDFGPGVPDLLQQRRRTLRNSARRRDEAAPAE